jgi:glutathione S-transferase
MVRFVLNEAGIDYILVEEEFWNFNEKFLRINPMGTVPVLITEKNIVLNHHHLILEYIHANHNTDFLFPEGNDVLETKKICIWFNEKLFLDCTKFFMQEKVIRYLHEKTHPNANILSLYDLLIIPLLMTMYITGKLAKQLQRRMIANIDENNFPPFLFNSNYIFNK